MGYSATYARTWELQLQDYTVPFDWNHPYPVGGFWACPSVNASQGYYFGNDLRTPMHHHYGINWRLTVLEDGGYSIRMPQVKAPSQKILIGDSDSFVKGMRGPAFMPRFYLGTGYPVISSRHLKGANALWFDSHVEWLPATSSAAYGNGSAWYSSPGWNPLD